MIGFLCVFFLSSPPRSSTVSVVFDFNASLNDVVPASPILFPVVENIKERSYLLMDIFLCAFFLSSPHTPSAMSVVFDFNDSLNDAAPVSPMLSSVDKTKNEKNELLMDGCLCGVFFLLSSLTNSSKVSVVFDFNDSLNDVAPACSMMLSVNMKRNETNDLLMYVFLCLLSFVSTAQMKCSKCCV